ncbi:hypothetical protein [Roseivirga sp. UBA1976]|nr:hypothetical protein [Roseivirga sp. UBA1976]
MKITPRPQDIVGIQKMESMVSWYLDVIGSLVTQINQWIVLGI